MRNSRKNKRKIKAEMNVVPYIDVMLVLLVIFMVTAPMMNQGVKIELPKVESTSLQQDKQDKIITISITKDGEYFMNFVEFVDDKTQKEALSLESIINAVSTINDEQNKLGNKVKVLVKADSKAEYGSVAIMFAKLQKENIKQVGLITENP